VSILVRSIALLTATSPSAGTLLYAVRNSAEQSLRACGRCFLMNGIQVHCHKMPSSISSLPPQFLAKKQAILSQLVLDPEDYKDKSPKGSVDIQILDLLRLINGVDGWVTTSSCSGRAAVFVEGPKKAVPGNDNASAGQAEGSGELLYDMDSDGGVTVDESAAAAKATKTAPGGKGGGHWLFVSHDRLDAGVLSPQKLADLFQLPQAAGIRLDFSQGIPRLVHLSFSPLILHVLCASLQHAKPLLAAAINAGFRESGVQSLKALEPGYAGDGVMVAIRTNGIVYDTVVGYWDEDDGKPIAVMDSSILVLHARVVNERFQWNEERKKRLLNELHEVIRREGCGEQAGRAETKEERRDRKRKEGMKRQQATKQETTARENDNNKSILVDATEDLNIASLDAT
jgi:tRNA wybutosine-synthesizing protein 3